VLCLQHPPLLLELRRVPFTVLGHRAQRLLQQRRVAPDVTDTGLVGVTNELRKGFQQLLHLSKVNEGLQANRNPFRFVKLGALDAKGLNVTLHVLQIEPGVVQPM